jgi:hypothetical protein
MNGVDRIAAERKRQVEVEGWIADHDADHTDGELAKAAACYALADPEDSRLPQGWPWDRSWWKIPKEKDYLKARIRMLEKAGALVAAEIDRLLILDEESK